MKTLIRRAFVLLLPILVLLTFFSTTNPNNLNLSLLLIPVLLITASVYFYSIKLLGWINPKNKKSSKQKVLALILTSSFTSVIVLQSINQLTLKDFSLFCLFTVLFVGYVKRINKSP